MDPKTTLPEKYENDKVIWMKLQKEKLPWKRAREIKKQEKEKLRAEKQTKQSKKKLRFAEDEGNDLDMEVEEVDVNLGRKGDS